MLSLTKTSYILHLFTAAEYFKSKAFIPKMSPHVERAKGLQIITYNNKTNICQPMNVTCSFHSLNASLLPASMLGFFKALNDHECWERRWKTSAS